MYQCSPAQLCLSTQFIFKLKFKANWIEIGPELHTRT